MTCFLFLSAALPPLPFFTPSLEFHKRGADPVLKNNAEETPSFYAIKDKVEEVLALLQAYERG